MANKKSTTKAKTTKSSKAKSKKSTSVKADAKKSKKTTSKKADKKLAKVKKEVTFERLRSLNMISLGVFVLLAVTAGTYMSQQTYQLTMNFLTTDSLSGEVAPAVRAVFDLDIRWALVGLLLVSSILPALYLTKLKDKYEKQVTKSRFVPWRWVDFGVTGALIAGIIALSSGLQNLYLLKFIEGAVLVAFLLLWLSERAGKKPKPVKANYMLSSVISLAVVITILVSAYASVIYGTVIAPWYVYGLYVIGLIGLVWIYRINFKELHDKVDAWKKNYLIVERNYLAVNLLTKTVFSIILILGLLA